MPEKERPIDTIAVVGLGQLGRGVAACCLAYGFRVVGVSLTEDALVGAR